MLEVFSFWVCVWLFGLASRLSSLLVSPASWLLPLLGLPGFLASPASCLGFAASGFFGLLASRLLGFWALWLLGFCFLAFFLASWLYRKKVMSSPYLQQRKAVRIILFANGRSSPPFNPADFFKPSMLMVLENHVVRIILLANWGIAAPPGRHAPTPLLFNSHPC